MAYPSLNAYVTAIQNPSVVFRDAQLRACDVEKTPLGLPKARSGGYAVTFKLVDHGSDWAVRCFNKEVPDLASRYAAITAHLQGTRLSQLVPFEYIQDGILIGGTRFPVVKMAWSTGQTLGMYLEQHASDRGKVERLLERFRALVSDLERSGIAHGDLQHGNMIVDLDRLVLIDYDGMFVPSLAARKANELGHVNYQSPFRDATHFGPTIDRFSAVMIYSALDALTNDSSLWTKYSQGGENILFSRADFVDPDQSALFRDLRNLPGFAPRVDQLKLLCRTPLDRFPSLEEFLTGKSTVSAASTIALPAGARIQMRQYDVVRASDYGSLLNRLGERIEVVGQIVDVVFRFTRYSQRPYAFFNFGDWRTGSFRLIAWEESLNLFEQHGTSLESFVGKWVSVTGLVDRYGQTPQIIIDQPAEIRILRGKSEADSILAGGRFETAQPPAAASTTSTKNDEIRRRLAHQKATGPATSPTPKQSPTPAASVSTPVPNVTSPSITTNPGIAKNDEVRRKLEQMAKGASATQMRVPQTTQSNPRPLASASQPTVTSASTRSEAPRPPNPQPSGDVSKRKTNSRDKRTALTVSQWFWTLVSAVVLTVLLWYF